jgi:hypothetical protein
MCVCVCGCVVTGQGCRRTVGTGNDGKLGAHGWVIQATYGETFVMSLPGHIAAVPSSTTGVPQRHSGPHSAPRQDDKTIGDRSKSRQQRRDSVESVYSV